MLLRLALQVARDDYEDRRERQRHGIELGRQKGPPQVLGSCGYQHWWVRIVGWSEFLSKVGTESTIIDSATNLKQQIGPASRPPHLLTFVHPAVHQEIGRPFGDRGANSQSGTMPLGVIDQPVALASQISIQRVQGGPQFSRRCDRLSCTGLALEMVHDRVDAIDADPRVGGFAVPQPPVQALNCRASFGDLRFQSTPLYGGSGRTLFTNIACQCIH
jgi:hypothetical protein